MQDIISILNFQPFIFANNTYSGILAGLDSKRSIAQNYEEYLRNSSDLYVELGNRFDTLRQMYDNGSLTVTALDEYRNALSSILDVQSTMDDLVIANRTEREGQAGFN